MYLITHWSEGSQRMILRKTIHKEDNYANIWGYDDLDFHGNDDVNCLGQINHKIRRCQLIVEK